jgi:hypothetical protein
MSTSSSSLAEFLAWKPFDALHLRVYHDIPFGAKHVTDILKNKVNLAYLHMDFNISYIY